MMNVWIAIIFSVLLIQSAFANSDTLDANPIMVTRQSPQFVITLPSNPTTGYSWSIQNYDQQLLQIEEHHYQAPTEKRIGAGGVEVWTFLVKPKTFSTPQTTTIRFLYARPWDKQDQSKTVEKTIVIQ